MPVRLASVLPSVPSAGRVMLTVALSGASLAAQGTDPPVPAPPATLSAGSAYGYVQAVRDAAAPRWRRGDTTGLRLLREAIRWMRDDPGARDLANGDVWFRQRLPNLWYDLVRAQLARGDTAAAAAAYERMVDDGAASVYLGTADGVEAALAGRPRFGAARARLVQARRWAQDSAFASAPGAPLTDALKLGGLALVWSEVRHGYPEAWRIAGGGWDSLYLAAIPRVLATRTPYAYYRELQRLVAHVGDSHTNVYFPPALADSLFAGAGLRTARVEGRVLVYEDPPPAAAAAGVARGDEVLRVDGTPVAEHAATRVEPYVSAATPQDWAVRTFGYELLRGPRADPVTLELRSPAGRVRTVRLARGAPPAPRSVVSGRRLGDVGYVRLTSFGGRRDSTLAAVDSLMRTFGAVRGVVLDIRDNGGGNTSVGYAILARFLRAPVVPSRSRTNGTTALYRARNIDATLLTFVADTLYPDTARHYGVPAALLVGPRTFSAAEDLAVAFDVARPGPIVGEATGGSTGQPLSFPLPGGGSARVRAKDDRYPDGRAFIGVGVQPHVPVPVTVADVQRGRDAALERAVDLLRGAPGRGRAAGDRPQR